MSLFPSDFSNRPAIHGWRTHDGCPEVSRCFEPVFKGQDILSRLQCLQNHERWVDPQDSLHRAIEWINLFVNLFWKRGESSSHCAAEAIASRFLSKPNLAAARFCRGRKPSLVCGRRGATLGIELPVLRLGSGHALKSGLPRGEVEAIL
jgi:hypothetical protein